MTSRQRAYLRSLAMNITPIYQIGKSSLTPDVTAALDEALAARELIKIHVLQNCGDDPKMLGEAAAGRTRSQLVEVIGNMIVLYRPAKDEKKRKIILP
ncbi:MAG: ribosome assembly RNA-binding protein YhbY [Lachnospiraceae bacterium]|jgi:RNA-binding protein